MIWIVMYLSDVWNYVLLVGVSVGQSAPHPWPLTGAPSPFTDVTPHMSHLISHNSRICCYHTAVVLIVPLFPETRSARDPSSRVEREERGPSWARRQVRSAARREVPRSCPGSRWHSSARRGSGSLRACRPRLARAAGREKGQGANV